MENGEAKIKPLNCDLENWMTKLPQELRNTPIIYLAIPGTHNSFTDNICTKSKVAPDAEKPLKAFKFLGPCATYFAAKWSRTQSQHAIDQLKHGIRYFDLRFGTKPNDDKLYFVHGLYAQEVASVLKEISGFIKDHPKEMVILDCQHFYDFKPADHQKLIRSIKESFGEKLMPWKQPDQITLDYMAQNNYQVICLYRHGASDRVSFLWSSIASSMNFPSPWHNTRSVEKLLNKMNTSLERRPQNAAHISQCILTPSGWFIFKNLFSNLKSKCKNNLDRSKYIWLKNQTPGKSGINIIITDFVENFDYQFAKDVIGLNEKVLYRDDKSINFDGIEWIDGDFVCDISDWRYI